MEARELRIGNLVLFDSNWEYRQEDNWQEHLEPYPIDCLMSDNTVRLNDNGKSIGCFFILQVNPIQLTEEWLVRLGFNYGGIWIELMGLMSCGRILQHKGMGAKSTAFYINEQFIANIQYLHELQNLYFALTGTELEITSNIHERG